MPIRSGSMRDVAQSGPASGISGRVREPQASLRFVLGADRPCPSADRVRTCRDSRADIRVEVSLPSPIGFPLLLAHQLHHFREHFLAEWIAGLGSFTVQIHHHTHVQRTTRPEALPPISASTSARDEKLKSPSIEWARHEAAVAKRMAACGAASSGVLRA